MTVNAVNRSIPSVRSNELNAKNAAVAGFDDAVAEAAAKAGIILKRPADDHRTAQEIIDANPLLKNLGNQGNDDVDGDGNPDGVKDMLKKRVGDFETDADAAYRAAQVLEHVEKFDENGNVIAGSDVGNGRIDGFTSSGDARHGTEAGRLQDFGKYGFSDLRGELNHATAPGDDEAVRKQAEELGIVWQRPEGDKRSAQDIIDANPVLKNLGNQSGVKDMLKDRVGDFEHDADAAYRAVQVLNHVEKLDENGDKIVGGDIGNGSIDGFTNSGEARHGTEAGRLQDFGKYGFSSLKGRLNDPATAGSDQQARKDAEALGFKWQRPEGDKRSAQDIINANPLLKNLGNQSRVKDMLKERVGDYENDADAAYRAAQVLDRVVMFDENGNRISGGDVSNSSIDGFTNSGEAQNGTEAGRLQDFGKYGFSVFKGLPSTDEISSYNDFLKNNPGADDGSKKVAKYAAILGDYFDSIKGKTGSGDALTAADIKAYREQNPQLSDEAKETLDFWSQPGMLDQLDMAGDNPALNKADGKIGAQNITNWLAKGAPTNAAELSSMLRDAAFLQIGSSDTSGIGKDIFDHPEKYTVEQRAAAVRELQILRERVQAGVASGLWDDTGRVWIANEARVNPDPTKVLADINTKLGKLTSDPDLQAYIKKQLPIALQNIVNSAPSLKSALQTELDSFKNGGGGDKNPLNIKKGKDGKDSSLVDRLTAYSMTLDTLHSALGLG